MPTASLAAFAVLLGASAAYGLSAGGASNVKDLGVGAKPPASNTIAQATPTPPPAATSSSPDTVPQATPTPPPSSSSSTPAAKPKPSKKAKAAKPKATTPSTSSATPSTSSSGGGGTTPHQQTTHHPHTTTPTGPPSWFADADPPYDAVAYGGGSGAKKAIDGSTKTAWTTSSTGTGIVVDTGQAQPYSAVGIATSTPGYRRLRLLEQQQQRELGQSDRERLEAQRRGQQRREVPADRHQVPNNPPRYLLIYVTKLASGGKTSINEVKLVL